MGGGCGGRIQCTNTEFSAVLIAYLSACCARLDGVDKRTSRIDSMNAYKFPDSHYGMYMQRSSPSKMLTDINIDRKCNPQRQT